MLDKTLTNHAEANYKFVIITLDAHSAGPVSRVQKKLKPPTYINGTMAIRFLNLQFSNSSKYVAWFAKCSTCCKAVKRLFCKNTGMEAEALPAEANQNIKSDYF